MTKQNDSDKEAWFPEGYEAPVDISAFMKLEDGENTFRVLSHAVTGWEWWDVDNKPHRSKVKPEVVPENIRLTKEGKATPIKHFWVFLVYNYKLKVVQSLELTQATVMKGIKALVDNPKWGSPTGYDISVTKTGKDLLTKYTVQPNPHSEITPDIQEALDKSDIKIEEIFDVA